MDNNKIKSILQDALEEQIPASEIDLMPVVQSRLVAGKTLQQGEQMNRNRSKRLVLSALAAIVVVVMALITPQGRAFAQNILQFFIRAGSDSLPVPTEPVDWVELTAGV